MPTEFDFDFPIIELEADSPQGIGKLGLFDIQMPVGTTGIVFVAAVQGTLQSWGPTFTDIVRNAAYLRAASTLAGMGIATGETMQFLRTAINLSQADLAVKLGEDVPTIQAWESNQSPMLISAWTYLADMICKLDGRSALMDLSLNPDLRPRVIRIHVTVPQVVSHEICCHHHECDDED